MTEAAQPQFAGLDADTGRQVNTEALRAWLTSLGLQQHAERLVEVLIAMSLCKGCSLNNDRPAS